MIVSASLALRVIEVSEGVVVVLVPLAGLLWLRNGYLSQRKSRKERQKRR